MKVSKFPAERPYYAARGPGQPPQIPDPEGEGACIHCGVRVMELAPVRPYCIPCFDGGYRAMTPQQRRATAEYYCHFCGTEADTTYGDVFCNDCSGLPDVLMAAA